MSALLAPLIEGIEPLIAQSPIWSWIGVAATGLVAVVAIWLLLRVVVAVIATVRTSLAKRKRRSSQGFGIAVAPIIGPQGSKQTKATVAALEEHLHLFTFGSPIEIVWAPRMRAKGAKGLRAAAIDWLEKSSTDLVVWGHRPTSKSDPSNVEVLSCAGSLAPSAAIHSEGVFPLITAANEDTTARVVAYLVARALQPGLSDGTAFKAEKLSPVADILNDCLSASAALPERTRLTLEADYSSMAIHIGGEKHLKRVAELRRARLSGDQRMAPEHEIQARIDLGRALLGLANDNFDPVRVREAMDHLKLAVELLRGDPVLRLAQATNQAVQQGQSMLENRKRFSVTGGSNI